MNYYLQKLKPGLVLLFFCGCCLTLILVPSNVSEAAPVLLQQPRIPFSISGKVANEDLETLAGVNIRNLRTKEVTTTNIEGGYTIKALRGDTITFTMLGYSVYKLVAPGGKSNINIALKTSSGLLKEVAVTALGIKREERELGYAYSEVNGSDINKAREPNMINSLAGKIPGLVINSTAGGPAGSTRVVIRGNTSVTGDNQPLYVIDGVPMDNSNYGQTGSTKFASGFDLGDAISAINPDDIEKISVLKGPSASALYGSSAANGVILITTKKGENKKDLGVEFNSTSSIEKLLTSHDGYQYIYGQGTGELLPQDATQARSTLFTNFGPRLDPNLSATGFDGVIRPYALVKNNIDNFFRMGSSFTNTVALASSTETSRVRFSASDLRVNDIVPTSGIRRNTFNLSWFSKFGKNLSVDTRAFYLNEKVNNRPVLADDASNIGNSFLGLANNVDQALFKTGYKDASGRYVEWGGGQYHLDPYWVINEMSNVSKKDRLTGSLQATYKFNSWINIQGRASTDITFFNFQTFAPVSTPGALTGTMNQANRRYSTNQADVLLTIQHDVTKDINLSARLGAQIYRSGRYGTANQYLNQTVTDVISANSYATKSVVETDINRSKNSVYALLTAAYKHFLYIDGTIRTDASSTLPKNNNVYSYASLSGSFVFTDAFKLSDSFLSFGKIRASAAEVGSDTDPYQLDLYYSLYPLTFQGGSIGSIGATLLPNTNLKPTRTRSFETGTELKFLKDRIVLDMTYYTSKSRDQINVIPAPYSSGFTSQVVNAGTIANQGLEIALSGTPVITQSLKWNLGVNFARNINSVESLADGIPYLSLADARYLGLSVVAKPGAPYGAIIGYNYQKDPNGNLILDPTTLAPLPTTDRQVLGKGTYNWTGGLNSTVTYKNWSFGAGLDVKAGAQIFSMTNLLSVVNGTSASTLEGRSEWIKSEEARLSGGFTPAQWLAQGNVRGYVPTGVTKTGTDASGNPIYTQNTRAVDPSVYWPLYYSDGNGVAVPFIYSATYIKVRELTLGYRFSRKICSALKVRDLSVTLVSRNPFILYKDVPNIDPDSNYQDGNGQGLEYGSLPSRRSFGVNLNLKF
jgi:TonB-linked SusC/RagA family outer membrane protein